jgi:hypothetical protein
LIWSVLLVALVVATASCTTALVGPRGVGGFVVSVYVLAVANVIALVELLSLVQAVSRFGLVAAQAVLALVAAFLVIALRPALPPLSSLRELVQVIVRSKLLSTMACAVGGIWAYQAVLALTLPPNTWDALTYHLARVAAWFQHGGIYWIPDAPTDRLNEFQPGAEELVLALVAVARDPWPYALPQLLAGCALVLSVGVASRALGFSRPASVFAMLLAATVPMVVMQATTAQNDLIAAALIGCASALILHGGNRSLFIAGIAVAVALGVKLTAILALPVLGLLALTYGWRGLRTFGLATVVPAMTIGAGGIWRNLYNTSHLLGHGSGRVDYETDATLGSTLLTSYRVGYRLLDLSGLDDLVLVLTAAGIVTVGGAYVALRRRQLPVPHALTRAFLVALPLLTPVIFVAIAGSLEGAAKATSVNVNPSSSTSGAFVWGVHTIADEDLSYLGLLGGWLALSSVVVATLGIARRVPTRTAILALSSPAFVVLLALHSTYNAWLGRFLLVGLVVALPLLAYAWGQPFRIPLAVAAILTLAGTSIDNARKPLDSRPWNGGRATALRNSVEPQLAESTAALDTRLKGVTCVVALLGHDDPSYLLYGPHLERRVVYATRSNAVTGDAPIVLGPRVDSSQLVHAGWHVESVHDYWRLALRGRRPGHRQACA